MPHIPVLVLYREINNRAYSKEALLLTHTEGTQRERTQRRGAHSPSDPFLRQIRVPPWLLSVAFIAEGSGFLEHVLARKRPYI